MSHTYTSQILHLIWTTQNLEPFINEHVRQRLHQYIGGLARTRHAKVITIDGTTDHIHLLAHTPPDTPTSPFIRDIKAHSSSWMKATTPCRQFAWNPGYACFGVSWSKVQAVCDYIHAQEAFHQQHSLEEEYSLILDRHGVSYKPEFLFTSTHASQVHHLVWSTKDRQLSLTKPLQGGLYQKIEDIIKPSGGALLAVGGMPDHIHTLVKMPTRMATSDMIRNIKTGSCSWVRNTQPSLRHFTWQTGFGAFTVSGLLLETVKNYILTQEEHHGGQGYSRTFSNEWQALLQRHGLS